MKRLFLLSLSIFALLNGSNTGCLKPSFSLPVATKFAAFSTDSRILYEPDYKPRSRIEPYHIRDLIFGEISKSQIVSICQFLDSENLEYFLNCLVDLQDTPKAAQIFYAVYYRAKNPEKYFIAYRGLIINFLEIHEKVIIEMLTRNVYLEKLNYDLYVRLKKEALKDQFRRNVYKPTKMRPIIFKASNKSISKEIFDHAINSAYSNFEQTAKQSACTLL